MSGTDREVLERQLAEELGFRRDDNGYTDTTNGAAIWKTSEFTEALDSTYAALLASRLKLSEVERERDYKEELYVATELRAQKYRVRAESAESRVAAAERLAKAVQPALGRLRMAHEFCNSGQHGTCLICLDYVALRAALDDYTKTKGE